MHICDWICEKGSSTHIKFWVSASHILMKLDMCGRSTCQIVLCKESLPAFEMCLLSLQVTLCSSSDDFMVMKSIQQLEVILDGLM